MEMKGSWVVAVCLWIGVLIVIGILTLCFYKKWYKRNRRRRSRICTTIDEAIPEIGTTPSRIQIVKHKLLTKAIQDPRKISLERLVSKSSDRYTTWNICLDQFQITHDIRSPSLISLHSNHLSVPTDEPCNSQRFQSHHRNQSATSLRSRASNGILGLLPCDHIYHFACIWEWLLSKNVCPTCKAVTRVRDIKTVSESAFVEFYENYCIQSNKLKLPRIKIEDFRQRSHSDSRYPQTYPFQFRARAHTTESNLARDRMLKRVRRRDESFVAAKDSNRRIFLPEVSTNFQNLNRRNEMGTGSSLSIAHVENLNELSPIRRSLLTFYPDVRRLNVQNDQFRHRTDSDLSVLYI